jgi:hypothetical protein
MQPEFDFSGALPLPIQIRQAAEILGPGNFSENQLIDVQHRNAHRGSMEVRPLRSEFVVVCAALHKVDIRSQL